MPDHIRRSEPPMTSHASPAAGLTTEQAEQSRREHGSNHLTQRKRRGFFRQFLDSFGDPIIKVLLAALAVSLVLAALFPQAYYTTGTSMNSFVTALPFLGSVIVVALIPAVSEEMLHRGILQYTLQPLGRKWMIFFLMGVYFGVFHLSFIRFLPMMFLGMVIAWIRQETGSMVYPMIFHFVNNFYALAVTFLSGLISAGTAAQNISVPLYLLGYSFLMAAAGPFFLYLGSWLVKRGISGQRIPLFQGNRKAVIGMAASVIALAVVGIVLFVLGIVSYL